MHARTFFAALLGMGMLFSAADSLAADNVCVINNSSVAISIKADPGLANYDIGANGGDQNLCWAFEANLEQDGTYAITLQWGQGMGSGDEIFLSFVDPVIGAGYFTSGAGGGPEWAANEKYCSGPLCVWHTDKTDVWRLYIEDAPAAANSDDDCDELSEDCQL